MPNIFGGRFVLLNNLVTNSVESGAREVGPKIIAPFVVTVGFIPRVIRPTGKPKGATVFTILTGLSNAHLTWLILFEVVLKGTALLRTCPVLLVENPHALIASVILVPENTTGPDDLWATTLVVRLVPLTKSEMIPLKTLVSPQVGTPVTKRSDLQVVITVTLARLPPVTVTRVTLLLEQGEKRDVH